MRLRQSAAVPPLSSGRNDSAAHLRRFGESAGGHDRGGDVDVLHHLLHRAARRNEFGTVGQHRHAYGGFVEVAFVDQSVFAPREAVVAHIDHQSRFAEPFGLQKIQQPPDGVVHAGHRLAVIAEVLLVRQCAVILVIDAVPAFPLVLYPVGEPVLAVPSPVLRAACRPHPCWAVGGFRTPAR